MPSRSRKSLGDLLHRATTDAATRPSRPSERQPAALTIRSVALTPGANAILEQIIADTSAATAHKVSASAVMRALLQWAGRRQLSAELIPLMMAELQSGEVVWGRSKQQ
jgi:hypothetical protein